MKVFDKNKDDDCLGSSLNNKPSVSLYAYPYSVYDNCLMREKETKDGAILEPICNFTAWATAEIIRDDGVEQKRELRIAGTKQDGTPLPSVTVEATELANLKWMLNEWPSDCTLNVIHSAEKHLQNAIRSTVRHAERELVFSVTGWKKIDGKWDFLIPGNPNYTVKLHEKAQNYFLEYGASDFDLAVGLDIARVDVIAHELLLPGLAFNFLSPLNEFMKQGGCEPKFILLLHGRTGSRKSTFAALMQSFFGNFTATDLPMSFRDTANAIAYKCFTLKDIPSSVDDFHPGSALDEAAQKDTMQKLCRAIGDRAARDGLTPAYELRKSYPAQGNVMVTAESIPDVTESGVARFFCVEVAPDMMKLDLLTNLQQYANQGVFRRVMGDYIEWLKVTYLSDDQSVKSFVKMLHDTFVKKRDLCLSELAAITAKPYGRTAEAMACLEIGYEQMLTFYRSKCLLTEEEEAEMRAKFHSIILAHAIEQTRSVQQEIPTHMYVHKLMALVHGGGFKLYPVGTASPDCKDFIGYEDDEFYYVDYQNSFAEVRKLCAAQGEYFPLGIKVLSKRMYQDGFIEKISGKNTGTLNFGSYTCRVMKLKKSAVKAVLDSE